MKIFKWTLPFILWASTHLLAKEEVEIPINIGIGPSFFWLPGLTPGRDLHTGARLDLYAVIDQATIKKFKNRIPKQYRSLAMAQREVHVAPMLMFLVPDAVIVSPSDSGSVYGATWTLFGMGLSLVNTRFFEASLNLDLPSLTYVHVESTANNPDKTNLFGIGAAPALITQFHFSEHWLLDLSYHHTFQLPLSMNSFTRDNGTEKQWTHFGEISIMLNYRFPMRKKM